MRISINGKMYSMTESQAKKFLKSIETGFKKGIYAVKKGDYIEMRNDVYRGKNNMLRDVLKWNKQGFTVYWKW